MGIFEVFTLGTVDSLVGGKGTTSPLAQGWAIQSIPGIPTDQNILDFWPTNQLHFNAQQSMSGSNIVNGSLTLGFNETAPVFELDGNSPISYNDLPAGLVITSLTLHVRLGASTQFAGTSPGTIRFSFEPFFSEVDLPTTVDPDSAFDHTYIANLINTGETMSPTDLLDGQIFLGFTYDTGSAPNNTDFLSSLNTNNSFSPLFLTGTYAIQQFKFSIDTDAPVSVDQVIDVSSPNEDNSLDLSQINEVDITYTTLDNVVHTTTAPITSQSQFHLTFNMPDFGDAPVVSISVKSTQFGGSVPLGSLPTILFIDGTGIYRLDTTATHDTLYVQDYDPVQTIDVKIPDPFIKTGYVP